MKRKTITLTAMLAMALGFAACDMKDNIDLLRHPIHIQGEVDPHYGMPVAYGQANINDLLHMMSGQYSGYIKDTDILTIYFDTTATDAINGTQDAASALPAKPVARKDASLVRKDTILTYPLDITLFDDVNENGILDDTNISINELWLSLDAFVKATPTQPQYETMIRNYVSATFDNLTIRYVDHDGNPHTFDQSLLADDSATVTRLLDGDTFSFQRVNLASIVNALPRRIEVSFRMRLNVSGGILSTDVSSLNFSQMLDELHLTRVDYTVHLNAELPFEIRIKGLPYEFTVDMGEGMSRINIDSIVHNINEGLSAELKDSRFSLGLDNGIPFDLRLSASFLDENDNPVRLDDGSVFYIVPDTLVSAAVCVPIGSTNVYHATGRTHNVIEAALDSRKLELLSDARKLKVSLRMATSNQRMVAVEKDGNIFIKAYVKVHPAVKADIAVTDKPIF